MGHSVSGEVEQDVFPGFNFLTAGAHGLLQLNNGAAHPEVACAGAQASEQGGSASRELAVAAREGRARWVLDDSTQFTAGASYCPALVQQR